MPDSAQALLDNAVKCITDLKACAEAAAKDCPSQKPEHEAKIEAYSQALALLKPTH